jgi:hypothetical protein
MQQTNNFLSIFVLPPKCERFKNLTSLFLLILAGVFLKKRTPYQLKEEFLEGPFQGFNSPNHPLSEKF